MDQKILINLIKNSLDSYDERNYNYRDFLKDKDIAINRNLNTINFVKKNNEFNYNVLGLFDNSTNIWMWSWMLPTLFHNETELIIDLLTYGLKISPTKSNNIDPNPYELYLKTQLVNSRFLINNKFQLELHLSLASYLLKKKFKFIYSIKRKLNEKSYITVYYIIY